MMNYTQPTSVKEQISSYLYFSTLYFVTVGVLYLWGYWATFDVNILEYLSLADVVKYTAYPIVSAFIFIALGAVIGEFITGREPLPPGGGRNTRIGRILLRFAPFLVAVYVVGTVTLFLFGPVEKWRALPTLFAFPVYYIAKEWRFLESLIPHDSPRSIVILLLAMLPTFAYGQGRLQATAILEGKNYKYIMSPVEGINVDDDTPPNQRLRLLGHAGDFLFLFYPAKETLVITRFENTKMLQLKTLKVSSM